MRTQLHDDWTVLGEQGKDYELVVSPDKVTVVMLKDGQEVKKTQRYNLQGVYAQLIHAAYERGRKGLPLY